MIKFSLNHMDGLQFVLLSDESKNNTYDVSFIEKGQIEPLYQTQLQPGAWAKLSRKYLSDIDIVVEHQGNLISRVNFLETLKDQRVAIILESPSLGDTLAWMPYCLKFQEHYGCRVVVCTFKNFLFKSVYPELEFEEPGAPISGLYACLKVGVYWDYNKEPAYPGVVSLQQAASDILCLPYEELELRMNFIPSEKSPYDEPYICIGTRSTAQCKHWFGWRKLISALKNLGFRVIEMSLEAEYYGAEKLEDTSLENTMNVLHHATLFIGLSSGLSWLNWAIKKKTVMISNFTEPFYEFQSRCVRITKTSVCHGCWNDPQHKFDRGNWYWCPRHANTPRQFECHVQITVEEVLSVVLRELQESSSEQPQQLSKSDLSMKISNVI